ncbi:MAG: hypothetical protein GY806_04285 [Gammaproteobacteria bacterium]|nr:hypothetical protein [Gammaproteobacteria bacterium]
MLFSILIFDEPDTAALRDEYRASHLNYLKTFDDQTIFAGPFTSDDESADLGSLRLIEFPDRPAAEQHVLDEPYVLGGVQKQWSINRWRASVPYTWRDCPRTEGNIQVLFHGLDVPDSIDIRNANRDDYESYFEDHQNSVMCRGPMLSDDDDLAIGDVVLLDVPDMATARATIANDPFHKAGCYQEITLHRWRFGRVFDRLKVKP